MALVSCPECQTRISSLAPKCPRCGTLQVRRRPVYRVQVRPAGATSIFVLGLLGMILCGLLGPIAWIQASSYEKRCQAMRVQPEGLATAGKILGIIATILICVQLFLILTWLGIIGAHSATVLHQR